MLLDQLSLLTAIAFSAVALIVTLFVGWLGARRDSFLLNWSLGLVLVVLGVISYGMLVDAYSTNLHMAAFTPTLLGFAFIYAGSRQFCGRPLPYMALAVLTAVLIGLMVIPSLAGWSGVGAIFANLGLALFMAMSGAEYWRSRAEAPVPMVANAGLYGVAAISFALCSAVLVANGDWVLTSRPENWAEELNAIVAIVGLTGIGAISLTLNQSRLTRHHRDQARTDSLTGLLNRGALFDAVGDSELDAGSAVIMFDLDHFKTINDQFGHAAGDAVLESFGRLVQHGIRSGDLAARLGGEEFCVVLRDLPRQSASAVAERIRSGFSAGASKALRGMHEATVSAGIAVSGVDGEAFESVLRRADEALYAAKSAGRNRVHAPALRLIA